MCVHNNVDLKQHILQKVHDGSFALHLGGTKIYHDLREFYWWLRMKREIIEYVAKCLTCQRINPKNQVSSRLPTLLTKKNVIWIIVDWLTKLAHFLVVGTD
ncbi:integrase [Gossypium australe]|uniref:Integrase n=1 Tax=Gossypium australe TaxID=47621 RepID=A0A5B6VPT3_9ROSI|nr:integrase [Gossypium australe]